ncbi:Crp/Fnr family transcriptional regulator [Sporosarcina sp. ACRSM]|uniref:Crp/Fnr family transcriptional regulator n=1 Tax=Sporosarcina sp. ACRSM TaxID=2918216 RepID=UPI001EF5387D|nr:Crp/Fnr family transcriptional regulator [Sporosarcina sp. ACRSM]MCG7335857.1 Crp/Fnr family transcriptional regulator [Sporosarcina sp. ACRSM]
MRYMWEPFVQYGQKRRRNKGEILYSQGEKGKGFYYLTEGKISFRLLSEDGKERIIDYMLEGFLFGEQGVSSDNYYITAMADTDVSVYYFSNESFITILRDHANAKEIFISSIISKMRLLKETYAILNKPYEQQMAHFIMLLCKKHDSQTVPITQIDLAQYIGTSRTTVYKIIQKWTERNLVLQKNRKIVVTDPLGMKALYEQT